MVVIPLPGFIEVSTLFGMPNFLSRHCLRMFAFQGKSLRANFYVRVKKTMKRSELRRIFLACEKQVPFVEEILLYEPNPP